MLKKKKIYNGKYEKIKLIGDGSYGAVYLVSYEDELNQKTYYAMKKLYLNQNDTSQTLLCQREISILKEINSPKIIKLIETFYSGKNLFIVYEYIETDLRKLIQDKKINLSEKIIKGIIYQILLGISHLHNSKIIHRDMKPDNILVSKSGEIKIADFGLARIIASPGKDMTRNVITRWYRPAEIFFGAKNYDFSIDMWSIGLILAELLKREPIITGNGDFDTLGQIFTITGVATEENWPGCEELPNFIPFSEVEIDPLSKKFCSNSKECINLLENLIVLAPNKRLTADQALKHEYFKIEPLPASEEEISEFLKNYW